jgi:hypothetical protein
MESILFSIQYRLTLKDGSFLETKTLVSALSEAQATTKLENWRKTKNPGFTNIEYLYIINGSLVIS